jgi:HD-like signal output (HDOD) protein
VNRIRGYSVSQAEISQQVKIIGDAINVRVNQGKLDLPMMPKVTSAVVAMTQDEDSDMAALAQLIQSDQSLAMRVMKIANSPAYRGVASMTSLQQAISRMGMSTIAEIALAASVGAKVFNVAGFNEVVKHMWKQATASGGWAKEIARIRRRNVESSFMCGLLNQIGKPVTLQALAEIQQESNIKLDREDTLKLVQIFYVKVGLALGKAWELPTAVLETIEFHQNYNKAPHFAQEAMTSAGADLLADHMLSQSNLDMQHLLENDVMADLNLYEDDLEKLLSKAESITDMVEAMAI